VLVLRAVFVVGDVSFERRRHGSASTICAQIVLRFAGLPGRFQPYPAADTFPLRLQVSLDDDDQQDRSSDHYDSRHPRMPHNVHIDKVL
jgi:hypothetical protein